MPNNGKSASDYRELVVAWRNGAAVRLADIAEVSDGVENINTMGLFNGRPAVVVLVTPQGEVCLAVARVLAEHGHRRVARQHVQQAKSDHGHNQQHRDHAEHTAEDVVAHRRLS